MKVLILVLGQLGRTPRLSQNAQGVGRDHWPSACNARVSCGLRVGQVIGPTNAKAERPTRRPCTPKELLATVYRGLGIDLRNAFLTSAAGPVFVESEPIAEPL